QLLGRPRRRASHGGTPGELDGRDADRVERRVDPRFDLVLERAGRRRQLDLEGNLGAVDPQVADHVSGDEVTTELRLLDVAEGFEDGGFGDGRHSDAGPSIKLGALGPDPRREARVLSPGASIS